VAVATASKTQTKQVSFLIGSSDFRSFVRFQVRGRGWLGEGNVDFVAYYDVVKSFVLFSMAPMLLPVRFMGVRCCGKYTGGFVVLIR
jgi:hypothetical protein